MTTTLTNLLGYWKGKKIKNKTDEHIEIELDVQVNHELIALLFSYMDAVEIIEPASLREKFKTISDSIFKRYK